MSRVTALCFVCILAGCGLSGRKFDAPQPAPGKGDAGELDGATGGDAAARDDAAVPDAALSPCRPGQSAILRAMAWPSAGIQVAVTLRDALGAPVEDAAATKVTLRDAAGNDLHAQVRPAPAYAGLTAILLVPTKDASALAQRRMAAEALVNALPDDERIVLWVGKPGFPVAAEMTTRRDHVLERIAQVRADDGEDIDAAVLKTLSGSIARLDAPWGALQRNLVVIGASSGSDGCDSHENVTVSALFEASGGRRGFMPVENASTWDPGGAPTVGEAVSEAAATLAGHLANLRTATVLVGACGVAGAGSPLTLGVGGSERELRVPAAADDLASTACDALAAASDEYPLGDRVELTLTKAEMATHDAYYAAENEADFPLHAAVGPSAPIAALAHFRGHTSLSCHRKNYSINFEGGASRRLFSNEGDDEFYLISMCKEPHLFRQVLANRVLADLGVFPLHQRYVELRINGTTHGVYLLLRKPTEVLLASGVAVETVIRRDFDPEDKPAEVRFPTEAAAAKAASKNYGALSKLIEDTANGEVYDALREHMDIDAYIRWMAFQTYFQNGDYVDETFFTATNEDHGTGQSWYFRNIAWDSDDLFLACHHTGLFAHVDPYGVVYCSEAKLDRAFFRDPDMYERLLDQISALSKTWTPARVQRELERVRSELFGILDEDAVCAASSEKAVAVPHACLTRRAEVTAAMNDFNANVHDRASLLKDLIAAAKKDL